MNQTARVAATTINQYLKNRAVKVFEKNRVFKTLQQKGRVLPAAGPEIEWLVQFRQHTVTPGAGMPNRLNFAPLNKYKRAKLGIKCFTMTEQLMKGEMLMQNSPEVTLMSIVNGKTEAMMEDFVRDMGQYVWLDGNAAGNTQKLHGFNSCMSYSGLVSNSPIGSPNDFYANLYTQLGYYSAGGWTPESGEGFPTGQGKLGYRFFSPLVVDETNANEGWTGDTWRENWQEAVNYGLVHSAILTDEPIDEILMTPTKFLTCCNSLKGIQTMEITQETADVDPGTRRIKYNGVTFTETYGMPTNWALGVRWKHVEIRNWQKQLVTVEKDRDITVQSDLIALDCWINMKIESPAYFVLWYPISAVGT